jgi:hypothetical protein
MNRDLNSILGDIAVRYVKLVLAVGQHDPDYVDAYYGPAEWAGEAKERRQPLASIVEEAAALGGQLTEIRIPGEGEIPELRRMYLEKQLSSLAARADLLLGRKFSFDEEARAFYDAVPPVFSEEYFRQILKELNSMLPGDEPLSTRVESYRMNFVIPPGRLDAVFRSAIEECRNRTKKHINLPVGEKFHLEYVKDKSWSGYNWFRGNGESLIQINTDLPIFLERAVDLAAHEGYPGHHVYNCLLEQEFAKKSGWIEFTVYPLFSPQSLIAEGTANFGIEVAFPGKERMEFERDVLFPIAGLDGRLAENYYGIQLLSAKLNYAGNEAARNYLDGKFSRERAARWLVDYALMSPERALQRTAFFDQYRSYVINYNLGQDLVKRYIEDRGGTADRPEKRWEEFTRLISSPRLPSGLL